MIKFWRAIKTAFQYLKRNFGLSFASIIVMTLTFFIVSVVGLSFYGSVRLVKYFDSRPPLTIFLRDSLEQKQLDEFRELVVSTNLVQDVVINDAKFSQDDLKNKYPELQDLISDQNKIQISTVVFVYGSSQNDLERLIKILEDNEDFMKNKVSLVNIDKIGWYSFDQTQANVIRDANKLLKTSGIAITTFLFLISSILIFITIKLTIQYHKRELEIMSLVGADGWFIRLPFIIDGMIYGIVGGLLSTGIIWMFKNFVTTRSQQLVPRLSGYFSKVEWPVIDITMVLQIIGATCLAGALVGALSSFLAIIKYVKK